MTAVGQEFARHVRDAMEQLQGEVELGLLLDPRLQSEMLIIKELFRQPLHLLVSVHHPLVQKKVAAVILEQIISEPFLLLDETSRIGQITKGSLLSVETFRWEWLDYNSLREAAD